jgi:Tfp pilus assembly PilM family ATPase
MPKLITLDLGSHAVKLTTWKMPSRTQVELDRHYEHPVPQDGTPPTLAHRLAALDVLLEQNPGVRPATSDAVLLAWPASEAAFHRLSVPFSDKAQIERTLPFTIENEVPFELEDMVLTWRMAEQSPGHNEVLVALARRERVREWLAALAERGFDPSAVHIDTDLYGPWGVVAEAIEVDADPEGPIDAPPPSLVAVVDVGHLHTTVSVVRAGTVQVSRSINVGGWAFTRAIAEAMNVPFVQAEQIKHGAALDADDEAPTVLATAGEAPTLYTALPPAARDKIDGAMGLLLAEVRSTLIKAEDTLGSEVSMLRITGGGSRIDQLREYLHTDLGVPLVDATDPRGPEVPPEFAVCHALVGAFASGGAGFVDLRVGDLAYRGRTDLVRAALGYGVSGAVFFSLAALLMFGWQYRNLMVEQDTTEEAVRAIVTRSFPEIPADSIDSMGKAEALMAQFTQDAVQRAQVLGDGTGGVPPTIDTLYALTKAFPPHPEVKVELSELTISPAAITFSAEAESYAQSAAVEEKLKGDPRFHSAVKGQEQRLANNHVRFPITITLGEAATEPTPGQEGG